MHWIKQFNLFLFDFDGLLVNTEELHYKAYKRMCERRGFNLDWSFERYCQSAHYHSHMLQKEIYQYFPELNEIEPDWNVLYAEKKLAMTELLQEGAVQLMPGVEKLLRALDEAQIQRAVVTHSPVELITIIRNQHGIFKTIPHWFTRHTYSKPKPDPECYQLAIKTLAKPGDKIIGFEDTPRGMKALRGTEAYPVLICSIAYPEIPQLIQEGVRHFTSFVQIPDHWNF